PSDFFRQAGSRNSPPSFQNANSESVPGRRLDPLRLAGHDGRGGSQRLSRGGSGRRERGRTSAVPEEVGQGFTRIHTDNASDPFASVCIWGYFFPAIDVTASQKKWT